MVKKTSPLDVPFIFANFQISSPSTLKVRVKEAIKQHNKEIGWSYSEHNSRDQNGDKIVVFDLTIQKISPAVLREKVDILAGLIRAMYIDTGSIMTEEVAAEYNKGSTGVVEGKMVGKTFLVDMKNVKPKAAYYTAQMYSNTLLLVANVSDVLKAEISGAKVMRELFLFNVQEYYEMHVKKVNKYLISKAQWNNSIVAVDLLETCDGIKKVKHRNHPPPLSF